MIVARDVHLAHAARERNIAHGIADQCRQRAAVRLDLSIYAQVLDGGVVHKLEGGYLAALTIPVERERMALSVEGAVVVSDRARHRDFLAEVDIVHQLGVDGGLSVVHAVAECLPVGLGGDFVTLGYDDSYRAVGIDGGGSREVAVEDELVGVGRIVGLA